MYVYVYERTDRQTDRRSSQYAASLPGLVIMVEVARSEPHRQLENEAVV